MIKRFSFGCPIETEATVKKLPIFDESELVTDLVLSEDKKTISIKLDPDDLIYGLGESVHGMNKRGFVYISNNTDDMHHDEDKYSLYGSHTFVLIDRVNKGKLGIFVDYPASITWDIGFTDKDLMTISLVDADYNLYTIEGADDLSIIKEFRELIGESYMAPKWAFGYVQSRWGYNCEDDFRTIIAEHKKHNLPLDSICMDIDYMDDYRVFTLNKKNFPDLKALMDEMKAEGIHILPNVDPGVKYDPSFDIYKEGKEKNYFCKDENGEDFITAVWPGLTVLPDFFQPEVRKWYGDLYKEFIEAGIDGFWNDMNEPALFYSKKHLTEVAKELKTLEDRVDTLTLSELWDFTGTIEGLSNNPEDYKSFYHMIDGKPVRHDKVHNLYSVGMTRASMEGFIRHNPEKMLLFSRASYIGGHRYGGIWTGDNSSYYSHMDLLMHQLPNLNMCGFIYVGADTGGFNFHTSEPLMTRFLQLSMFTPLFRNHCALGKRDQELYRFKDIDTFRNILNLRYAFIPYLYEAACDSAQNAKLMFTPLSMAYPEDKRCRNIEDQLLVGDSIMIAPVTAPNACGRYVYLPEKMRMLKFRSVNDFDEEVLEAGNHYIDVALEEVLVFVRPGHQFYMAEPANRTSLMQDKNFTYFEM